MLHHHLPLFLSRAAIYGRHAADMLHSAFRMTLVGLRAAPLRSLWSAPNKVDRGQQRTRTPRISRRGRLPLLIHYHIFKNAGTSFEWALEQALGDGYRSFDTASPQGFISARDLVEFSFRHPVVMAISSHQAGLPPPKIFGREVLTSILIRDPIARIRSIYAFERMQKTTSPGAVKAKKLSFREYVEWRLETSPTLFCNFQVYFCSRTQAQPGSLGAQHLEVAISNLDTISIVGTVARYDQWLALAEKTLQASIPGIALPPVRQNATAEGRSTEPAILENLVKELGESTAQYLLQKNDLDMCLHQVADALLTRRLAERGVDLHLLNAYSAALPDLSSSPGTIPNETGV